MEMRRRPTRRNRGRRIQTVREIKPYTVRDGEEGNLRGAAAVAAALRQDWETMGKPKSFTRPPPIGQV